jgi:PKD repeat protein
MALPWPQWASRCFSSGSQPGSGGPIVEYVWDFGDGNQDNSGPAVSYTYTSPGTFTVTLTIADRQGQSDTAEWPIQISAAVEPPPQPTENRSPNDFRRLSKHQKQSQ